jgi:hypothetical protein
LGIELGTANSGAAAHRGRRRVIIRAEDVMLVDAETEQDW